MKEGGRRDRQVQEGRGRRGRKVQEGRGRRGRQVQEGRERRDRKAQEGRGEKGRQVQEGRGEMGQASLGGGKVGEGAGKFRREGGRRERQVQEGGRWEKGQASLYISYTIYIQATGRIYIIFVIDYSSLHAYMYSYKNLEMGSRGWGFYLHPLSPPMLGKGQNCKICGV